MKLLDPDMPTQELLLHMGELTESEIMVARSAIRWANTFILEHTRLRAENVVLAIRGTYDAPGFEACVASEMESILNEHH